MRKAGAILLILLMGLPILLAAQDWIDEPQNEWDEYFDDSFTRGDQTFIITLGTIFPIVFFNQGKAIDHKLSPPVGGIGSLAYNYFFNKNYFAGAEVAGMFNPTFGGNTLFMIPVGIKAGYQINYWRLEIPLSVSLGMVWHRYLDQGYFGMYMKGGGSVFYRAFPRWSFGGNLNWYWFPEWTGDKTTNVHGNFLDFTVSARYHF